MGSTHRAGRRHVARRSVVASAAGLFRRAAGQATRLHRRRRRHGHLGDVIADAALVTRPLDQAMLADLGRIVTECTTAFDGYDYARSLERTERFFWSFCDDYVELVKARSYDTDGDNAGEGQRSAAAALQLALSTLLRLFAPILPFVT